MMRHRRQKSPVERSYVLYAGAPSGNGGPAGRVTAAKEVESQDRRAGLLKPQGEHPGGPVEAEVLVAQRWANDDPQPVFGRCNGRMAETDERRVRRTEVENIDRHVSAPVALATCGWTKLVSRSQRVVNSSRRS